MGTMLRLASLFVLCAGFLAAPTAGHPASESRKDKAALLLYGGLLSRPVLIEAADTSNMVDILLLRMRGEAVPVASLAGRPCVGVAIFTVTEWHGILAADARADVGPDHAALRIRLFPAVGDLPAVVHDPRRSPARPAWTVVQPERLRKTSLPVRVPPDTEGGCDVEL